LVRGGGLCALIAGNLFAGLFRVATAIFAPITRGLAHICARYSTPHSTFDGISYLPGIDIVQEFTIDKEVVGGYDEANL
jgi:hypothetical protein